MKIALLNLPWKRGRSWGVRAGSRWPHIKTPQEKDYLPFPFFLATAAALLEREGFEVCLIDAIAEELSVAAVARRVACEKPDLLVAETSTPSLPNDLEILKRSFSQWPTVLCGPDVTIREEPFLLETPHVAYVMVGEYEQTLLELAQALRDGKPLEGVAGLIYRAGSQVRVNPARPLLDDLDMLPWPKRDALPIMKYHDIPGGIPVPSVQMWTSRGCPYQCVFCAWPQLMYRQNRYRVRRIADVVDEMAYLVKELGFKSVYFDDDTTNIGKMRMIELAREIKGRGLDVPWAMMARADLMDEEVLKALKSAGLAAVKYGVESAVQRLVDNANKNMDIRKTEEMILLTKRLGIKTHLTFTFGLPGETPQTVQETIAFALRLDPDSLQFSITTPFPGTAYFSDLEARGYIVSRNLSHYDGHAKSILRTDALTPTDLEKAKKRAEAAWRRHVWETRIPHLKRDVLIKKVLKSAAAESVSVFFEKALAFSARMSGRLRKGLGIAAGAAAERAGKVRDFYRRYGAGATARRLKSAYLDILGVYHGARAFKGPACVQIDLTNRCNNNCIGCWCNSPLLGERIYKGRQRLLTLPTALVRDLIDELATLGTEEIYFSGGGEPFMHPDLLAILRETKSRGMRCAVNTNFTLIDEAAVRELIEIGLDGLTVSVWAGKPGTYAATHPNKDEAAFFRIRSLLSMLNSLKAPGRPFVKVYHVLSNLNYREIGAMVDFAKETQCEGVEFAVIDTIPGATDALALTQDQRQEVLEQLEEIKDRTQGVILMNMEHLLRRLKDSGADSAQYDSEFLESMPCCVGWVFSRVMPNGDVNFCLKAHRVPVGNLYRDPFRAIWNSPRQMEFRRLAMTAPKSDPFFRMMGNDPDCAVGCYKSCDDLGRIVAMHNRMNRLSWAERKALRAAASVARLQR